MEAGTVGDALNPWGVGLFRTLKIADPKTVPEQAAYSKWLDQTSDREETRRDRMSRPSAASPTTVNSASPATTTHAPTTYVRPTCWFVSQ
ncbi:MAG: hypothetical protein ABI783_03335 [Actinomycetota bacterium]